MTLPPAELIDLVLEHQGLVTREELLHRYSSAAIEHWLQEQVLVRQGEGFTLDHLTAYVDGLVLAAWAVPGGIIGARSSLVFHGLTVAMPKLVDMSLPPAWQGTLPAEIGIRPLNVPPGLRTYGVMTVFPTPPGSVPVEMYAPAVALVQVWADPTVPEEDKLDGLMMYRAFREDEELLLQEAQERYGVILPAGIVQIV
jgi:hypothetical protein